MAEPSSGAGAPGACAVLPLRRHCLYTLILHRRFLGDLGDIDGASVRDIMKHCSHEEMATIEDCTRDGVSQRDLSWYSWHLWHHHYVTEMGHPSPDMEILPLETEPPGDYTPPITQAPEGDWRGMMEQRQQEMQEKAARLSGRLRSLYQAEQQLRDSRKVEVCKIKAPVKRRRVEGCSRGAGSGSGSGSGSGAVHSGSISGSSSKGKMLKGIGLASSKARSIKMVSAPVVNHKSRTSLWRGPLGNQPGQRPSVGASGGQRPGSAGGSGARPAAPPPPVAKAGAGGFLTIPAVGAGVPAARGASSAGPSSSQAPAKGEGVRQAGGGAAVPAPAAPAAAAGSRGPQAKQFTVAPVGFHPSPNLVKKKGTASLGGGAGGSRPPPGCPAPSGYSLGAFQRPPGFKPEAAAGRGGSQGAAGAQGRVQQLSAGAGSSQVGSKRPAPGSLAQGRGGGSGPGDRPAAAAAAEAEPAVKRSKLSTGLTDRRAMMEGLVAAPPQGRGEQQRLKLQVAASVRQRAAAGVVLKPVEDY